MCWDIDPRGGVALLAETATLPGPAAATIVTSSSCFPSK